MTDDISESKFLIVFTFTVDSTANDGAEIDIIEGNKTNTFSNGLHWDGYGEAHKTNGEEI